MILMAFVLISCGGGNDGEPEAANTNQQTPAPATPAPVTPPPEVKKTGVVKGSVQNAKTNVPVEGLKVSIKGNSVTTDAAGNYTVNNVEPAERIVVTVSGKDYAEQSKIVRLQEVDQPVDLNIKILPVDVNMTFNPDLQQDIKMAGSEAMVKLNASALMQDDGSAPEGMVTANLTVIDPGTDIELMPGDLQTEMDDGSLMQIESFGAITATFNDANGTELNLAQGQTATIRIPVAANTTNPPATIPLYYFNTEKGMWVKEGTATLDATNKYYEGSVTHFSTWNADRIYDRVLINGCVENTSGDKLSNISILADGIDYTGRSYDFTNANGDFSIYVKSNARVSIFGRKLFTRTNKIEITTTTSNQTITPCLVLPDSPDTTTPVGGTLIISGEDTAQFGTELKAGYVTNFADTGEDPIIWGVDEGGTLSFIPIPGDTGLGFYIWAGAFDGPGSLRVHLILLQDGIEKASYFCLDTPIFNAAACDKNTVSIDINNKTITFNNTVVNESLDQTGKSLTISGTLNWQDLKDIVLF